MPKIPVCFCGFNLCFLVQFCFDIKFLLDGFYGDIVVPNVLYDLELKAQRAKQKPSPGWDENFDQVEPKMLPPEEDKQLNEDDSEDDNWRLRLQRERNRRIKNTGDPAAVEVEELVKKKSNPKRLVDFVKDGPAEEIGEKIRHANERETKRARKRGPRKNSKKMRLWEDKVEFSPTEDEAHKTMNMNEGGRKNRREQSKRKRRKRKKR